MEVIAHKIVGHSYTEESLKEVYAPNELKAKDFEWNKNTREDSPVCKELGTYDIGYCISNINNPKDDYGFCFLNEQPLPEGNYVYTIELIILDTNLPESIIKRFFSSVVLFMRHTNRNCMADTFRVDRLISNENYPLSEAYLKDTSEAVIKEVCDAYIASKSGSVPISEEQENRLREIADKMKNALK